MTVRFLPIVLLAALALTGCTMPTSQTSPLTQETALAQLARDLRLQLDQAKVQQDQSLEREKALNAKIRELEFVNQQQKRDLEVLAPAPALRDQYKARVEALEAEIAKLRGGPSPASQPVAMPAAQPATIPAGAATTQATTIPSTMPPTGSASPRTQGE